MVENDIHYKSNPENLAVIKSGPLYDRFVSNMWNYQSKVSSQNLSNQMSPGIIPMKMDGCNGLRLLHSINIIPDVVYIDASHHYDGVLKDITTVLELFPNVDLVGNSWDYPDVQRAVKVCAAKFGKRIHVSGLVCWTFAKDKCETGEKETKKRQQAEVEAREESAAKRRAISKMSLKDLMGQYKKKK